jgi:peptide/nickel transport system permease protein
LKEREFLAAARAARCTDARILTNHVLPNVASTITILATLQLPVVIVWESALSFLGHDIQPPIPSLGQMLSDAQSYLYQAWWLPAIPGATITLVVLALNLLGDRLRDVLDPHLRSAL